MLQAQFCARLIDEINIKKKKILPSVQENWVQSLGWEDPLEKGMATHSSILVCEIHRQSSLVSHSLWGYRDRHD